MMHIDYFADTVCPWCYIGYRRLRQAIAAIGPGDAAPALSWRSFQLNPGLPPDGIDRDRYLAARFGGLAAAQRVHAAISRTAAADGLAIDFGRIARVPNTLDSHRLIRLAAAHGRGSQAIEALQSSYFSQGRDIGDRATLIGIGESCGLAAGSIQAHLESPDGTDAVLNDERDGRAFGIAGVPFLLVNRRYAIAGVQPVEVLVQVLALGRGDAGEA
ncbi:MAG: DsbA family oxidoreductase [Alphaproteobacteria bacterium]|nr:DsbA family oxidoreductase [Alphaproteobacteria bacterium]